MYAFFRGLGGIILKVLFFIRVEGQENVPKDGAVIICSNHKSNWDVLSVAIAMTRHLSFIAKAELFKVPIIKTIIKNAGAVPVKRGEGDISAIKTALGILKNGNIVTIFPEGTRVRNGKKIEPKPGAVRLSIMTGVPIVPVGIRGNYKIFNRVLVRIGQPIDFSKYKGAKLSEEEIKELSLRLMNDIYALAKD